VVGPPGETTFTDKYGRAKVQFPWDRQGKKDCDSSCWLRMSSVGAGKGFGFVNLPRVGQEVLVAFVEGDPDRPVIVGAVFNAEDMPPQKLAECRTQFGLREPVPLQQNADAGPHSGECGYASQIGTT
jgi:type VI secretion system secreted protein VgrG